MNELVTQPYRKHGLTRNTKRLVFAALLERQQEKCFICGISQAEIKAKPLRREVAVHRTLHIDHCHVTGMIRGLLCGQCNSLLGLVENTGLLHNYLAPAYEHEPLDMRQEQLIDWFRWQSNDNWLEENLDTILLYMQQERWLPRKDILFHLQSEAEGR